MAFVLFKMVVVIADVVRLISLLSVDNDEVEVTTDVDIEDDVPVLVTMESVLVVAVLDGSRVVLFLCSKSTKMLLNVLQPDVVQHFSNVSTLFTSK